MKNSIKLNSIAILLALIATILMANFACAADLILKIGVLANRGVGRCLAQWSPTADYVTAAIPGKRFEIIPIDFDHITSMVEQGALIYD